MTVLIDHRSMADYDARVSAKNSVAFLRLRGHQRSRYEKTESEGTHFFEAGPFSAGPVRPAWSGVAQYPLRVRTAGLPGPFATTLIWRKVPAIAMAVGAHPLGPGLG